MADDRREEEQALSKLMDAAARRGVDLATLIEELRGAPAPLEAREAAPGPEEEAPVRDEPSLSGWQLGMVRAVEVEAAKVLGSVEAGHEFMRREQDHLDGRRPIAVAAESTEGAERVLQLLGRIKYGACQAR